MNGETWLEKATQLQRTLGVASHVTHAEDDERLARDRIKIALWLRREFDAIPEESNILPFSLGGEDR